MDIETLMEELVKKSFELQQAQSRKTQLVMEIAKSKIKADILEKCRQVILLVGKETQEELKNLIEHTVTLAVQSVYGSNYKFMVQFNYDRRDQLEVSFFIDKNGLVLEPRKDTIGYGIVDVISFSLKMVMWMLAYPSTAPVIWMDEPFKNVSAGFIPQVSEMVRRISDMLKVQFIISTHIDGMIEAGDLIHQM